LRFKQASLVIASLVLAISFPSFAAELVGRVTAVQDGDSIIVLDDTFTEHRVRLGGIDAPERSQAYGQAAKKSLSSMVFGNTVRVVWEKTDPYGRTVGKVLFNGQDINLKQIQSGYAWHYRQYQSEQRLEDREAYAQAEIVARQARIGLWQEPEPIPPWRYRRSQRNR
jgi:endonuclease YncB( thermonuclease family)